MRDFMKKEVVFYNVFNRLESVFVPSLETKMNPHASIQKQTETFVTDLQEDFPATVSTIFRTGDKLSMGNSTAEDECCILCQAPMDTTAAASSAVQATEFSRMISALGPLGFDSHSVGTPSNDVSECNDVEKAELKSHKHKSDNGVKYCGTSALTPTRKNNNTHRENKEGCHCSRSSITITLPEAEACFCYGCRLIAKEMKELYLNYLCVTVIKSVPLSSNMLKDLLCHFMLQH
jgi:hypothetical protein